jgi:predicted esterase
MNIRFALPRAAERCPSNSNQICWTWAPKVAGDLKKVSQAFREAAKACFPSREYSVLGFSNGGIAASAFLRLCMKNDFKSIVAIGSGGGWYAGDPKTLKNCKPKLISMIGSEDHENQKPARDFVSHLSSIQAPVKLFEYKGCHELLHDPLAEALKLIP